MVGCVPGLLDGLDAICKLTDGYLSAGRSYASSYPSALHEGADARFRLRR